MNIDHPRDLRDQPLPTPAEIDDALLDLFTAEPDAMRMRVLALLQTPRYDLIRSKIMALAVRDGRLRLGDAPFAINGQDTPDDGAPDNDWVRIVKPYLHVIGAKGRLWPAHMGHRRSEFPRSFDALAERFPALRLVAGKQTLNLQHACAAALEGAGVDPRRMMFQGTRGTPVLQIANVQADGGCPPAMLSASARSIVRAWAERRMRDTGDPQAPLFIFRKPKVVLDAIAAQRRRVRDLLAARHAGPHVGVVTLPTARTLNARILELFADQPHPELARACARLHAQPYWLGSAAINALRVVNGVLISRGQALIIDPEDDDLIFQPCLDAQRGPGGDRVSAPFLSARDRRGVLRSASRNTPSIALGRLVRACPEYGFLKCAGSTEEALRALAATALVANGVAVQRLCRGASCLRMAHVRHDGQVEGLDLPPDARHVLAMWRERCARWADPRQPLLAYASRAAVDRAVQEHRARLALAHALADSPPAPITPRAHAAQELPQRQCVATVPAV